MLEGLVGRAVCVIVETVVFVLVVDVVGEVVVSVVVEGVFVADQRVH